MAQVVVTEAYLSDIAQALRSKLGTNETFKPSQMGDGIRRLPNANYVVLSGQSTPSSDLGENENLYIKYEVMGEGYDHSLKIKNIYRKVSGAWEAYTDPTPT